MMKIYRKWDYDLIVSTALGAANSIGISLNERDRYRIEQMAKRFCERTRSGENDSSFVGSSLYVIAYSKGLEIKSYANLCSLNYESIGAPCGEFFSAEFIYCQFEIQQYYIRIK